AGKSTLMRIIAGAHEPDNGEIRVAGRRVQLRSPADAQAQGIAIIYQEPTLFPDLSVSENVMMGRQPTVEDEALRQDSSDPTAARILHTGAVATSALAAIMLIGVFLPWVTISRSGGSVTINGLHAVTYIAGILTVLCALALPVFAFRRSNAPWLLVLRPLLAVAPALLAVGGAMRVISSVDILQKKSPLAPGATHATLAVGSVLIAVAGLLAMAVLLWSRPRILSRKMFRDVQSLCDSLGVRLDVRGKIRGLSVADQQTVEIAKALSSNARILIMDEPTAALSLHEVKDLFRIVRRLRETGVAIVFISHRLEEVFAISDRITVLRDGKHIASRPIGEIGRDELVQMMVGRSLDTFFPKQVVPIGEVMLSVQGLTRHGIFSDIGFEVRRGEIVGLSGLVGARRTEVARAIFGIDSLDAGTVEIEGKKVRISSPRDAINHGLAYVPEDRQQEGLVLPMAISHNVTLPLLRSLTRRGFIESNREQALAREYTTRLQVRGMSSLAQRVRALSGGNQQKVVLGKWLATKPKVLILDEPTRGIDVGTKAEVHRLMSELAGQGLAILMISSELPEILGMSDRVVVMREGRQMAISERAQATQESIMRAATGQDTPLELVVAG
ncbi:MAG: transporter-like protein, partial [Chloroflexi bacterium]|nr:transporter-like protein [Chloroflexota bacterium]